jgi:hypothetical protein
MGNGQSAEHKNKNEKVFGKGAIVYIPNNGRVQTKFFFPGRSSSKRAADVHAHINKNQYSQSLR